MMSNSSLRGGSIEEERNGVDENKKQDLRNISEERDDPAPAPESGKCGDSKLIDFSPEQVRTEKWMEECLHEQEIQYQQLLQQQVQQQQQQQQQQHEPNGQSKSEHTKLSPEKQVI